MSIEHAGAPLKLEPKVDYMKRKIEERSLAPNSQLDGTEEVCTMLLWLLTAPTCNDMAIKFALPNHTHDIKCLRLLDSSTATSLFLPCVFLQSLVALLSHS